MIPPRGFNAELYPLRHKFLHSFGLGGVTATQNSTIAAIIRCSSDSAMNDPDVTDTNPHHPQFAQETGVLVSKMSMIERIKIMMSFTLTEDALNDGVRSMSVKYMPMFGSFAEKLASTDDRTSATAASVLELVTDATNEDVIPLYLTNDLPTSAGASTLIHPVSTVNDTEVFGDLGLTTNLVMEPVAWDNAQFFNAISFFTNKGAIKSMVGKQRTIRLTDTHPHKTVFINKFVPRAVRRCVPFSFFSMLFHLPLDSESDQNFYSGALTTSKPHIGVKMHCQYHEWNADHNQKVDA